MSEEEFMPVSEAAESWVEPIEPEALPVPDATRPEETPEVQNWPDPVEGAREWVCLIELATMEKTCKPLAWLTSQGGDLRPCDNYLAWAGYYGYIETAPPEHDEPTQKAVEVEMVRDDVAHTFTQAWEVVNLDEQQVAAKKALKWSVVRMERNQLLSESDWTQLSDVAPAVRQSWVAYRQALRDITTYDSPWVVVWPEKPE